MVKRKPAAHPPSGKGSVILEPRRYIVCPAAPHLHPPVGVPIWKGPKSYFVRCGSCRTNIFLSPAWSPEFGLTQAQLKEMAMGFAQA